MPYESFEAFFEEATGHRPYPYQKRLAGLGLESTPPILNLPTGSGKTETAILGLWLWKRINGHKDIPRRLIYCLPMRVLAEQTAARAEKWIEELGLKDRIGVELFMGGTETRIQRIRPDGEYIIVGTQDLLVSAALNRLYGNNPSVWPIAFGMVNNDCIWIMDEVQIMENTLPTSIQLDCFRESLGTYGPHKTVWMSATVNPEWMETADRPSGSLKVYELGEGDGNDELDLRNNAAKTLRRSSITLKKRYNAKDARAILKLHKESTSTGVIVNNVKRAQALYAVLTEEIKRQEKPTACILIHSRFRHADRVSLNNQMRLAGEKDAIVVSTQVLEAGVDVSFRTMFTELAPWSSMVQRFGRCNRYGRLEDADVHWIDVAGSFHAPYADDEMDHSRNMLKGLEGKSISPANMGKVSQGKLFDSVLRRRDIVNLFDTAPDLSGNHIDVSRFVRNMDQQLNVDVFWRKDAAHAAGEKFSAAREELCSVPIGGLKTLLGGRDSAGYEWSYAEQTWRKILPRDLFPGQVVMLDTDTGGYSTEYGWDEELGGRVDAVPAPSLPEQESHDGDGASQSDLPVTLEDHTTHVIREAEGFLDTAPLDDETKEAVLRAATYHDIGKAHRVFQSTMRNSMRDRRFRDREGVFWAKSQERGRHEIPGFRHEVASALAFLARDGRTGGRLESLAAYLIMSHHGKVRLSLRGPYKRDRRIQDDAYILGIRRDGDMLPRFSSAAVSINETPLDVSIADVGSDEPGSPSWTERVLELRDHYGPFRIAYLEALLRRADWLASENEREGRYN